MTRTLMKHTPAHPRPDSRRAKPWRALTAPAAVVGLLLTGCGAPAPAAAPSSPATATSDAKPREAAGPTPRLVLSHDGGLTVLDAKTLKPVGGAELDGFLRLNPAGDGRHVLVSTGDAFRIFDAGAWSEPHGDHSHHYTSTPRLTDRAFAADHAGHVVRHAGRTVLFSDGSGKVESFDPKTLSDALKTGLPATTVYTTPQPHHGVAVELADGKLLVTRGDEKTRTGITILGPIPQGGSAQDRPELLKNDDCPGVHGEAVAAQEAVVVGCQDGMLIYRGGKITKVHSPDSYGRLGNQAGSEKSPVILGDYKVDQKATLERPTRVSLVDTRTATMRLVDLGTSYSFRSLGRGPAGEALVLGTDGALRVIDPATGRITSTIPVVGAWTESETWQDPRPTLHVRGTTAYITEPGTRTLHTVDLGTRKVTGSTQLEHIPNEMTSIDG
ncbi:zinc metallochaperone AztD [Arthrobacter sp. RAF14]|uniref:zinc metallochaperone AztD n=1 Tax=Arthrobacter sp. RAF14 TaxID=3233051 RepID=UPI003F925510